MIMIIRNGLPKAALTLTFKQTIVKDDITITTVHSWSTLVLLHVNIFIIYLFLQPIIRSRLSFTSKEIFKSKDCSL